MRVSRGPCAIATALILAGLSGCAESESRTTQSDGNLGGVPNTTSFGGRENGAVTEAFGGNSGAGGRSTTVTNAGGNPSLGGSSTTATTDTSTLPAGGSSSSGGNTAVGGAAVTGGTTSQAFPLLLSETGLYESDGKTLSPNVLPFKPRFELWSDGATKKRFLYLPVLTQIDTTDPDFFNFPVGTKVWKEFTRDGIRIETRLIEKVSSRVFRMVAFVWNDAGTDAVAMPEGLKNAKGTPHDVPSENDCVTCHQNQPGRILGLSAIQLDHGGDGVTLDSLAAAGQLTTPVPSVKQLPGDVTAQTALGALHVNCGTCHNPRSTLPFKNLDLWLRVNALTTVMSTSAYQSAVNVATGAPPTASTPALLIAPGHPENSAILYRLASREVDVSMPPLGTEIVDTAMVTTVSTWISALQ